MHLHDHLATISFKWYAARREEEKSRPNNMTLRGSFVIKLAGWPRTTDGWWFVDEKLFVRQITHTRRAQLYFLLKSLSSRDSHKEQVALIVTICIANYGISLFISTAHSAMA